MISLKWPYLKLNIVNCSAGISQGGVPAFLYIGFSLPARRNELFKREMKCERNKNSPAMRLLNEAKTWGAKSIQWTGMNKKKWKSGEKHGQILQTNINREIKIGGHVLCILENRSCD